MNTKLDIENLLKRFRSEPAPRVKRAVLAKYSERYGRARAVADAPFWRRPVPLYFVAGLIVATAGFSFVGGRRLSRGAVSHEASSPAARDTLTEAAPEREWSYAPNDIF